MGTGARKHQKISHHITSHHITSRHQYGQHVTTGEQGLSVSYNLAIYLNHIKPYYDIFRVHIIT